MVAGWVPGGRLLAYTPCPLPLPIPHLPLFPLTQLPPPLHAPPTPYNCSRYQHPLSGAEVAESCLFPLPSPPACPPIPPHTHSCYQKLLSGAKEGSSHA